MGTHRERSKPDKGRQRQPETDLLFCCSFAALLLLLSCSLALGRPHEWVHVASEASQTDTDSDIQRQTEIDRDRQRQTERKDKQDKQDRLSRELSKSSSDKTALQ